MIEQNFKKRKRKDGLLNTITYIFASFGLIILVSIIAFVHIVLGLYNRKLCGAGHQCLFG